MSFGDAASFPSCNCDDWQHFKLPCKHLCSVFQSFPDWGWDMLNGTYTANPLINLDFSCIQTLIQDKGKQVAKLSHFNPNANVTQVQANVTIHSTTSNSSKNINSNEPSSSISNPSEISKSSKENGGALETSVQTAETSAAIESIKNNSDSSHKTESSLLENQRKTLLGNMETVSKDPGNSEQVESLLSNLKEFLKAVPKGQDSSKTANVNLSNGQDSVQSTEALVEGSRNKKPILDKLTPGNHVINFFVKEIETEVTVSTIPEGASREEGVVSENESQVAPSNTVNSTSKEERKGSDGLLQQDSAISVINLESTEEIPSEESLMVA